MLGRVNRLTASRWGIILVGALIGLLAPLLQKLGNPPNMGICVACFERDIAGALGLHRAAVVQYIRPEIIGFVLGAMIAAFAFREFKARAGSAPIVRFILGMFAMIGALAFLGCPWRALLRLAGGDLNALLGLAGLAAGIAVGVGFQRAGYNGAAPVDDRDHTVGRQPNVLRQLYQVRQPKGDLHAAGELPALDDGHRHERSKDVREAGQPAIGSHDGLQALPDHLEVGLAGDGDGLSLHVRQCCGIDRAAGIRRPEVEILRILRPDARHGLGERGRVRWLDPRHLAQRLRRRAGHRHTPLHDQCRGLGELLDVVLDMQSLFASQLLDREDVQDEQRQKGNQHKEDHSRARSHARGSPRLTRGCRSALVRHFITAKGHLGVAALEERRAGTVPAEAIDEDWHAGNWTVLHTWLSPFCIQSIIRLEDLAPMPGGLTVLLRCAQVLPVDHLAMHTTG